MGPSPRAAHGLAGFDTNSIVIFGGRDISARVGDTWFIRNLDHPEDPKLFKWEYPQLEGAAPAPRSFHTMSVLCKITPPKNKTPAEGKEEKVGESNTVYPWVLVFGGLSANNVHFNDVFLLDLSKFRIGVH